MFTYKRMNDTLVVFDFTLCFQHDVLDNIAGIIHKDMGADTMVLTSNTEKLLKSKVTHEMISALKQACEEYDYIVVSGKVAADILMFTSEYRNPVFKIEGCSLS